MSKNDKLKLKKKFNYKEQKEILDARIERSKIIGEHLKQERLRKEAREKIRKEAKRLNAEEDKKRSNYKSEIKRIPVSTTRQGKYNHEKGVVEKRKGVTHNRIGVTHNYIGVKKKKKK